jgi:hypothetical protein
MAKRKQSRGLGDTIAKVTKATGIDKVVEAITDGCGCEERRRILNEKYSYRLKVVNCPTDEQLVMWNEFKEVRTLTISNEQRKMVCKMYSEIFNTPYFEPCVNCSPKPYIKMINDIDKVIE